MHGGSEKNDLAQKNFTNALKKGLPNLQRHVENIKTVWLGSCCSH